MSRHFRFKFVKLDIQTKNNNNFSYFVVYEVLPLGGFFTFISMSLFCYTYYLNLFKLVTDDLTKILKRKSYFILF